ncbi:DUF6090 family protein [Sediminicola arcticus]|jgi:hypothetical protein|uniref:DUF6090 family protein n=1 Tax=Sediminicola arcticus TaxID=1574308 RepID=A0ABV2ST39_9FLAO
MIKFFRKIRHNLLSEGKTGKYLKYSVGEIILVVIGILIALSINNWNENRKEKLVEIEILEGVRADILKDTIDINFNIRSYEKAIEQNKNLVDYLIKKRELDSTFIDLLWQNSNSDLILTLHNSYFSEAKQKGLSIISNKLLREKINRLYEFDYINLLSIENELKRFKKYDELVTNRTDRIFIFDDFGKLNIQKESYEELLSDHNFKYLIILLRVNNKQMLDEFYLPTKGSALKVVEAIEKELIELKK